MVSSDEVELMIRNKQDTTTSLSSFASNGQRTCAQAPLIAPKPVRHFTHMPVRNGNESTRPESPTIQQTLGNKQALSGNINLNSTQTSQFSHQDEKPTTNEQRSSKSLSGKLEISFQGAQIF